LDSALARSGGAPPLDDPLENDIGARADRFQSAMLLSTGRQDSAAACSSLVPTTRLGFVTARACTVGRIEAAQPVSARHYQMALRLWGARAKSRIGATWRGGPGRAVGERRNDD
jgi:hypothetical protein